MKTIAAVIITLCAMQLSEAALLRQLGGAIRRAATGDAIRKTVTQVPLKELVSDLPAGGEFNNPVFLRDEHGRELFNRAGIPEDIYIQAHVQFYDWVGKIIPHHPCRLTLRTDWNEYVDAHKAYCLELFCDINKQLKKYRAERPHINSSDLDIIAETAQKNLCKISKAKDVFGNQWVRFNYDHKIVREMVEFAAKDPRPF